MDRRNFLEFAILSSGTAVTASRATGHTRNKSVEPAPSSLGYAGVRKKLADLRLFIVPYSHNDWSWVHTRQWQADRAGLLITEVLDALQAYPEFRFYIDTENEELRPFLDRYPERVEEFKQRVREGKIAVCGGTICNQHPGWMEGETFIRDMILGRRFFRELVPGLNQEVLAHIDCMPGYSQVPQLANKAGYKYFRYTRPIAAQTTEKVPHEFVWVGLDGSEILCSRGSYGGLYERASVPDNFEERWEETFVNFYEREIARRLEAPHGNLVWLSMGSDDSRPLRSGPYWDNNEERPLRVFEFIQEWRKREQIPLQFATPVEFFQEVEKERAHLPVHRGVLEPTMWTYWYGLNGNKSLRLWKTATDEATVQAEKFQLIASLWEGKYAEKELYECWRDLLQVSSHAQQWLFVQDYQQQLDLVENAHFRATRLAREALQKIASQVKVSQPQQALMVFNSLSWDRTDVIEITPTLLGGPNRSFVIRNAEGRPLPLQLVDANRYYRSPHIKEATVLIQVEVPALGYTTLYVDPSERPFTEPARTGEVIDTDFCRLNFTEQGPGKLYDKENRVTYRPAGQIVYNEIEDIGPYHHGAVKKIHKAGPLEPKEGLSGPLRSNMEMEGPCGPHQLHLTTEVYPTVSRVAYRATIQSVGGDGHFVTQIGFPFAGQLHADVPFGVEKRELSKVTYGTPGPERLRENVFYGSHWADYSDGQKGLALVGIKGEKGFQYDPKDRLLSQFLLMTVSYAKASDWERFVTPTFKGLGEHHFRFFALPHKGDWKEGDIFRRALEARFPFQIVPWNLRRKPQERHLPEQKSFLRVSPLNVILSAFYQDQGKLRVRVYECQGEGSEVTLELPRSVLSAHEVDLDGNPRNKKISTRGSRLSFPIGPWEVTTITLDT